MSATVPGAGRVPARFLQHYGAHPDLARPCPEFVGAGRVAGLPARGAMGYRPRMDRAATLGPVVGWFALAGLCEIGGGYLMWLALRERRPAWVGAAGAAFLVLYGWVATRQPLTFGRAYAAYGGVFVAMSIAWGWAVDGARPDRFDLAGGLLCLAGVAVIALAPRG